MALKYNRLCAIMANMAELNPLSSMIGDQLRVRIDLTTDPDEEAEWEIFSHESGRLSIRSMPHGTCELSICLTKCVEDEEESLKNYGYINLEIQETLPGRMYIEEVSPEIKVLKYGFIVSSDSLESEEQCHKALRDFQAQVEYWEEVYQRLASSLEDSVLDLEKLDSDFEKE